MKHLKRVLMICLCLVSVVALTGCGNKKAITAEEFKSKMEKDNYEVQDATYQMSQYKQIKKIYIALDKKKSEQIEFYVLSSEDKAIDFFKVNQKIFKDSIGSSHTETNVSIGNTSRYVLNTDGRYKVLSRIGNTVVYCNVSSSYKDTLNKELKKLNY
ncbi:MAG: hypothetical protein E7160_03435 [Firmicutes bacterium]|nr:hypothetical protein [Bacillota bacterium]